MPGFVDAPRSGRHGHEHTKARAAAFAVLPEYSVCARGRHRMWKWAKDSNGKSALHYDHRDDNAGYIGFSCSDCNRKDGARKGRKAQGRTHRRTQGRTPSEGDGLPPS